MLDPKNYRMLAVSGVMYHIYANVLKDLVTDYWRVRKKKVLDTQVGSYLAGVLCIHCLF